MMMKSDLDHLPADKQEELKHILKILFEEFDNAFATSLSDWKRKGRVRNVILFGSYARGDWVDERSIGKGYQSDYDLLIVVSHAKLVSYYKLWNGLWERLFHDERIKTPVTFIVHTLDHINKELALGRYFFCDIRRQGIMLYETPGSRLKQPQRLSAQDALKMAKDYSAEWFENLEACLDGARFHLDKGQFKKTAFELHQATEAAYHAFLLTLTNYTPATHNLNALRALAEGMDQRLVEAWPAWYKERRKTV